MATHTLLHLHNAPATRDGDLTAWFEGRHTALLRSDTAIRAQRYEIASEQVMPDIPQPWRFLSVYDLDIQESSAPLAALAASLVEARQAGLIAADGTERLYGYRLGADWRTSANHRPERDFSGLSILLGNVTPGREADYERWYEDVHQHEVTAVPGNVAMRRGVLADLPIARGGFCPGDQLVMCAQQTDDLAFTIQDFVDRALGRSPSGVAMQPRSNAASTARTVHYFRRLGGDAPWPGGVAYAGDPAPYAGRRFA